MFRGCDRWRSAFDVAVGVICLLVVTSTTVFPGPPAAEATTQWGSHHYSYRQQRPAGGCLGSRLCCPGKNSSCRVEGPRANDRRSRTCYCDTACFTTNDCCDDMQLACNIRTSARHSHQGCSCIF